VKLLHFNIAAYHTSTITRTSSSLILSPVTYYSITIPNGGTDWLQLATPMGLLLLILLLFN